MSSKLSPAGALLVLATIALSACASKPDRRGPPERGGEAQSSERPNRAARTSGTFMQPIAALFAGMDADGDAILSRAELTAGAQDEWQGFASRPSAIAFSQWSVLNLGSTDATPGFMSFDRDFNGVVSEDEFKGQLDREFTRLDKNNDNRLERSEMLVAVQAPRGADRQRGNSNGRQGGGRQGGGQGGGRPPR